MIASNKQPIDLKSQPDVQQHDRSCQSENGLCGDDVRCSVVKSAALRYDMNEDYKMTSAQRGICLIINNVNFELDVMQTRKGSDMDAFKFKRIFRELGFTVESKRNLTSEKMKSVFKQICARCVAVHDALVVILLSHGTESGIYGTDGLEVDLNYILTCFDNKNCKSLKGKPKVFIVQACRGRRADYGVGVSQTYFSQPESQTLTQSQQLYQMNSQPPKISRWSELDKHYMPTRTDMILCFSCHTGFVSTRNEDEGSWLGASLAQHLQNESCNRHLIEILNMTSRDVRSRKSTDGYKQVLEITSIGFDKNLYFNPGLFETNETTVNNSKIS